MTLPFATKPNVIPVGIMQDTTASIVHTTTTSSTEEVFGGSSTDVPSGTYAGYFKASPDNAGVVYIKTNSAASATSHDVALYPGENSDQLVFTENKAKNLVSLNVLATASGEVVHFILKG